MNQGCAQLYSQSMLQIALDGRNLWRNSSELSPEQIRLLLPTIKRRFRQQVSEDVEDYSQIVSMLARMSIDTAPDPAREMADETYTVPFNYMLGNDMVNYDDLEILRASIHDVILRYSAAIPGECSDMQVEISSAEFECMSDRERCVALALVIACALKRQESTRHNSIISTAPGSCIVCQSVDHLISCGYLKEEINDVLILLLNEIDLADMVATDGIDLLQVLLHTSSACSVYHLTRICMNTPSLASLCSLGELVFQTDSNSIPCHLARMNATAVNETTGRWNLSQTTRAKLNSSIVDSKRLRAKQVKGSGSISIMVPAIDVTIQRAAQEGPEAAAQWMVIWNLNNNWLMHVENKICLSVNDSQNICNMMRSAAPNSTAIAFAIIWSGLLSNGVDVIERGFLSDPSFWRDSQVSRSLKLWYLSKNEQDKLAYLRETRSYIDRSLLLKPDSVWPDPVPGAVTDYLKDVCKHYLMLDKNNVDDDDDGQDDDGRLIAGAGGDSAAGSARDHMLELIDSVCWTVEDGDQIDVDCFAAVSAVCWKLLKKFNMCMESMFTVEAYVNAMFQNHFPSLFPERELKQVLTNPGCCKEATRLLVLFYLLVFEARRIENPMALPADDSIVYSNELIDNIQLGELLGLIKSRNDQDRQMKALMMRFAVIVLPHMFMPISMLTSLRGDFRASVLDWSILSVVDELVSSGSDSSSGMYGRHLLHQIWSSGCWVYGVRFCEHILRETLEKPYLRYRQILQDPVIVAKLKKDILSRPGRLEIHMLAVRMVLLHHCHLVNCKVIEISQMTSLSEDSKNRNIQCIKMFPAVTRCAIIQIFLELLADAKQQWTKTSKFSDAKKVIFSLIHDQCLEDGSLACTLHMQTYDISLLPDVLSEIPSMHVCIENVPQILLKKDIHKQVFGLRMLKELSKRYPLTQTFIVAKLAVSVFRTIIQGISKRACQDLFEQIAPVLVDLCHTFPLLISDGVELLCDMASKCDNEKMLRKFSLKGMLGGSTTDEECK